MRNTFLALAYAWSLLGLSSALAQMLSQPTYVVGATAVTQYEAVMLDPTGKVVPASLTVATSMLYVGIAQISASPGQTVAVASSGTSMVAFSSAPTSGDVAVTQSGSALAKDTGTKSVSMVTPQMPIIGTVISASGSKALVALNGLGVAGTADFLSSAKSGQQTLAYGGLNMPQLNARQINGIYDVGGYTTPTTYTPGTSIILGTGDGISQVFTTPSGVQSSAFAIFAKPSGSSTVTRVPSTLFTTPTPQTISFVTAPALGTVVTAIATPYDMARGDADYAVTNGGLSPMVVLPPGTWQTCNDAPFPVTSNTNTTSMVGYGQAISVLQKMPGCGKAAATFEQPDTPNGNLKIGYYQGFTVDASHIDSSACEFHGLKQTTIANIACIQAAPGADHVAEFGDFINGADGWADNIWVYGLTTYDYVGAGGGAILTPVWLQNSNGTYSLSSVTITNPGTKAYNPQFAQALMWTYAQGQCSTIPTMSLALDGTGPTATFANLPTATYGYINSVTITNPGVCSSTTNAWIVVRDGNYATYGIKNTNVADSVMSDLEPLGANSYGIYNSNITAMVHFTKIHPFSGELVAYGDYGTTSSVDGLQCDSASEICIDAEGPNGTINSVGIEFDRPSYLGSVGIRAAGTQQPYGNYQINNVQCAYGSGGTNNPGFQLLIGYHGAVTTTNPAPPGVHLHATQSCDTTYAANSNVGVETTTNDLLNYTVNDGFGIGFNQRNSWPNNWTSSGASAVMGIHQGFNGNPANMLWLKNATGGGDADAVGVGPLGNLALSEPVIGDVLAMPAAAAPAPVVSVVGTAGSSTQGYYCVPVDYFSSEGLASATTTLANSNGTPSSTNYNTVLCAEVPGAVMYHVYRAAGGSQPSGYFAVQSKINLERNHPTQDTGEAVSAFTNPTAIPYGNGIGIVTAPARYGVFTGSFTGKRIYQLPDYSGIVPIASAETVAFSETPIFSGTTILSNITLSGSVRSFAIGSGPYDGFTKTILACENSTGGNAFPSTASPANVRGFQSGGSLSNKCSQWQLVWSAGQNAWMQSAASSNE